MKSIYIVALILILPVTHSRAQQTSKPSKPFIIQGQLKNFADKQIIIGLRSDNDYAYETIPVDSNGRFFLKSKRDIKPVMANVLVNNDKFITNMFLAPGYNLTITADCKSPETITQTKQITGYGSAASRYIILRDSVLSAKNDKTDWYHLSQKDFILYEDKKSRLNDSVARAAFTAKTPPDEYYNFFKSKIFLDIKFSKLSEYLNVVLSDRNLSYQQSVDFIYNNFSKPFFNDLYNKENLKSEEYHVVMYNDYCYYLLDLDRRKDSTHYDVKNSDIAMLKKIAEVYEGPIKDRILYAQMTSYIRYCRSFENLKRYRATLPPYISLITDTGYRSDLNKLFTDKEADLVKLQVGKPAPVFTAHDSLGNSYSVDEFKGKVVVLDLWASWCIPCRHETPYLKTMVEKYKSDNRIVFVSVAVLDKENAWKKAMADDKPTWLQLFDNDGSVQRSYVANSIPKFVVINKQGDITSFDAPMPSDHSELQKILDVELAK